MKHSIFKRRDGFTLIEILIVVSIIAILAAILLPAIMNAINAATRGRVRQEAMSIQGAVNGYFQLYGKLPWTGNTDTQLDGNDSKELLKALTGSNDGSNAKNPRRHVFFESDRIDTDGTLLDEWGTQYRVYLDMDYDGEVTLQPGSAKIKARVVVHSLGKDTVEGDPTKTDNDDVATINQ